MKCRILWSFVLVLVLVLALAVGINAQETSGTGLDDIFSFDGYALSPDGKELCAGVRVNYDAKAAYEREIGRSVDIGCVFASYDNLEGRTPLDENGKPIKLEDGQVIVFSLNSYEYTSYDLRLTDFNEDMHSFKFVITPYLFDGENVYYYQENGRDENPNGISYEEVEFLVHEHTYVSNSGDEYIRTEATCTANATYYKSCSICGEASGEWFELTGTSLGHTPQVIKGVEATCTTDGMTDGSVCSVCGTVITEQTVISAKGHNYEVVSSKSTAPTLNAAGKKVTTCAGCNDTVTETVAKLTATKVTKEQIYSIETNEYNPALTNIWKVFDGNIATSDVWSAGNDWFGNIGDVLTITLDQEMYISSLYVYVGGNYTFATVRIKDAKGNVTGSKGVCANVNAYGGSEGNKVTVVSGKNILAYTIEVEITGLKWESAKTFKLSEVEINGADIDLSFDHTHIYRDFVGQSVTPTCVSLGTEEYACYCGKTKEYSVPMLPHTFDTLVSLEEATCTKDGLATYVCQCGELGLTVLQAKGHIYERFVGYTEEPTIAQTGMAIYQCVGCSLRAERVSPMLALEDIKYLRVAQINGTTVTLKFNITSSPVDYEVRYSASEITSANFNSASVLSATVTGDREMSLTFNLNASLDNGYYVAVRPYKGDNIGEIYTVRVGGNKLIPIDYSDSRVYHGELIASFLKMFDEQYDSTRNGTPSTTLGRIITDTSDSLLYGMTLAPIVDLEYMHYVSDVYVYFGTSGKPAKVRWSKTAVDFMADDADWEGCCEFTTSTGWKKVSVSNETRYIQIVFEDGSAPSEVLIYGYQCAEGDQITLADRQNPTMSDMMGMCGFVAGGGGNTPIDSVICSTVLREYHNFGWSYKLNEYYGKPAMFEGSWMCNFDYQYSSYTAAGLNVIPCIQWDLKTIQIANKVDENNMPVVVNNAFVRADFYDRFNAHTYFMYADSMFTIAARFGSNTSAELLEIANKRTSDRTQVVGLGTIKWIELGNEPDGTWNGIHNYYSAYQYAALLSAGYDGHCGTLVSDVLEGVNHFGVKTADPNVGVAMAGIAAADCNYVNAMCYWMKANRADGIAAFDAFNGHHYMTKMITLGNGKSSVGISPEEGNLKGVMSHFVNLRNKYYSDKEVWLTEFGWDTNQSYATETSAHAYGEYTGRQVQAMWLTRAYLLLSSCGVDKATMYMCEDAGIEEESIGKYGTCGVIGFEKDENGKTVEVKKDSYYYMYTLKNTLGDYRFVREIHAYEDNVLIYEYANDKGEKAYAAWCSTSDGTKVEKYQLAINSTGATLVEAVYGDIDGVQSRLTSDELGCVEINITENPIYILVD